MVRSTDADDDPVSSDERPTRNRDHSADDLGRRDVLKSAAAGVAAVGMGKTDAFASIDTDRGATEGSLTTDVTGNYAVGGFTVELTDDPRIRVTHPASDGALWASRPGENVVSTAVVDVSVEEQRGSFTITEDVTTACAAQTVASVTRDGDDLVLVGSLAGDDRSTAYQLRFSEPNDGHLKFDLQVDGDDFDRVGVRFASAPDERCYGFGEQPSRLNLKGEEVPVVSQEGGIGRGHPIIDPLMEAVAPGSSGGPLTTYVSMPYYLSDRGYSFFLENTAYSAFDLTGEDGIEVRTLDSRMTGRILAGETPLSRIERFTEYAGRMDPLPEWFHEGAVIGMQGGTEKVRDVWSELQARDAPVSAFWLQDWVGSRDTAIGKQLWWNWELDESQYPNWDELRADLEREGVNLMGYINPYLADPSEKGDSDRNLYREAVDEGYVVETESGDPYTVTITDFPSAIVDLSDPDAREWYKGVIQEELLGVGLRGWMADFGEALPFDCELADADPETFHNRYPVEWAELNAEATAEAGRDDAVFFTRSGFTRSPTHSDLFWEGDQMVTWHEQDGFKSAVLGIQTAGLSGIALNHSDAGGYTSIEKWTIGWGRERGLLKRWCEANAFSPVLRTHEGNQPSENVQFYTDDDTYDHFARCAKIYAALQFYREKLMAEAAEKGYPVVRHPMLHYPDDDRAHRLRYQYLLGSEFMVAPIVEKGATERDVYLPDGQWTHVWTGEAYDAVGGTEVTVDAPMGEPPVFFRTGSEAGTQFLENLQEYGVVDGPGTRRVTRTHEGSLAGSGDGDVYTYEVRTDDPASVAIELDASSWADLDLYVTLDGRTPTTGEYDARSFGFGGDESIELDGDRVDGDATLGILVESYSGSGDYELAITEEGSGEAR